MMLKWGLEGYGLYWYCLEQIAREVSSEKLTFELEHDAEIIAFDLRLGREKVEEMMRDMVELGLFESCGGQITCIKMMDRMDTSMSGNPAFRKALSSAKEKIRHRSEGSKSHDSVMLESAQKIEDRTEDRTEDKNIRPPADADDRISEPDFDLFWTAYPRKVKKRKARDLFFRNVKTRELLTRILTNIADRIRCGEWCPQTGMNWIPHPTTWINNHGWDDVITPRQTNGSNMARARSRAQQIIDELNGGDANAVHRLN